MTQKLYILRDVALGLAFNAIMAIIATYIWGKSL